MALELSLNARGSTASYIRLVAYRWDANAREASAIFSLFVDRAHSERCKARLDQPVVDVIAKLRLTGEKFDEYLAPEVLATGAAEAGTDILAHLYAAARVETLIPGNGMRGSELRDFGAARSV